MVALRLPCSVVIKRCGLPPETVPQHQAGRITPFILEAGLALAGSLYRSIMLVFSAA